MNHPDSISKAALLMLITRFGVKSLGLLSSLILVRIITPEDFGLVAIAMSIYSFLEIFGLFGLNNALIHKTKVLKSDYDASFTANLSFGLLAGIALFFSATTLADTFNEPELEFILKSISFMFVINGAINIKVVDFQKSMNFTDELKYQLFPKIISFVITLSAAWYFKNYYALIIGMLANSCAIFIFSYVMKPYLPRLTFKGIEKLLSYSKWLMLNSFLFYINNNSLNLIVGRFISTRAAGLYSIGNEIASLPLTEVAAPINKASFPAYSNAKSDSKELHRLFIDTTYMIVILALPLCVGLIATINSFIPVVLGEQWIDASEVMVYIALASLVAAFGANIGYIFMAIGIPKMTFFVSLIRTIIFVLLLVILIDPNDLASVAKCMFIATSIATLISFSIAIKYTNISLLKTLIELKRVILSTTIMYITIRLFSEVTVGFFTSKGFELLSTIVLGALTYSASIIMLWWNSGKPKSIEQKILEKVGIN